MVGSSSSVLPQWKRSIPKGTTGALLRSSSLEEEAVVREEVTWLCNEAPVAGGVERELCVCGGRGRDSLQHYLNVRHNAVLSVHLS